MLKLQELPTTDTKVWQFHETYRTEDQAAAMLIFYVKQVGYKAAKVVIEPHMELTSYHLYVLVNKEA